MTIWKAVEQFLKPYALPALATRAGRALDSNSSQLGTVAGTTPESAPAPGGTDYGSEHPSLTPPHRSPVAYARHGVEALDPTRHALPSGEDTKRVAHDPAGWCMNTALGAVREKLRVQAEFPPLLSQPPEEFRGGQLQDAWWFWRDVLLPTVRPHFPAETTAAVERWLTKGVSVFEFMKEFHGEFAAQNWAAATPPTFQRQNHPIDSAEFRDFADNEVAKLLRVGAIEAVDEKPHLCLPIGVVMGHKLRMIFDARFLNCWTPSPDMSYESLRAFQRGINQDDFVAQLDHKSGYHHVRMAEDSWQYLGFRWKGRYYVFRVLPFGWAPACYVYNTLSDIVATYMRMCGVHLIYYLDDFGFAFSGRLSERERHWELWRIWAIMYFAGYCVARDKSMLIPQRTMTLLGFGIDTHRMRYFVPEGKVSALLELLEMVLSSRPITVTVLQSLVGKAQAMSLAIPPVSIFLKSSYRLLSLADRNDWRRVYVPRQVKDDLRMLRELRTWFFLSVWPREQHVELSLISTYRVESDASGYGYGGALYLPNATLTCSGRFVGPERDWYIHIKEMYAAKRTLMRYREHLHDCYVDLYTDNEVLLHTMLKGSSTVPELQEFAKWLLAFQIERNIVVRAHRVTSEDNRVTDCLSRETWVVKRPAYDRNDHMLNPRLFEAVRQWYGCEFTIDICAGPLNCQVNQYVSRFPEVDRRCVGVNALAYPLGVPFNGDREHIYCNPPWEIISPLWRHFRLSHARGVMIVPRIPRAQWFAAVMAQSTGAIVIAQRGDADVFRQPSRAYESSVGPVPWDVLAVKFDF